MFNVSYIYIKLKTYIKLFKFESRSVLVEPVLFIIFMKDSSYAKI